MKASHLLIQMGIAFALFVGGVAVGIFFHQNYRIVPAGSLEQPPTFELATPPGAAPFAPASTAPVAPTASTAKPSGPPAGTFSYRFQPGERLQYRMVSSIQGSGIDLLETSDIGMAMDSRLSLRTESVDPGGTGSLRVDFDETTMRGNFMGSPFELYHTPDRTVMTREGQPPLDTANGQTIEGIPQLEFLNTPIRMQVARDGRVLEVSGAPGMEKTLSPSSLIAPIEFDGQEMPLGHQWKSDFQMAVPGVNFPIPAQMLNTLQGYETVRGRNCAVIHQELLAKKQGGQMLSPESALGENIQFTMPTFEVRGENLVYFDVASGHIVRSDMDFTFALELGQEYKAFGEMLDFYSEILDELESGRVKPPPREKKEESLLKLALDIDASLELQ